MAKKFILAIDQGTTGSTVLVLDVSAAHDVAVIGRHTVEFKQYYPKTGWVEHDLEEIWQSVVTAAKRAMAVAEGRGFDKRHLVALGITNQRETLCVFARHSGEPLARAIVWQDKRSTAVVGKLKDNGLEPWFRERTGLVLDPYFTGTKVTWLMENEPTLAAKIRSGEAVLGTIDTYLIARLTGGVAFVTEASNASRTLLYDIGRGQWSDELLQSLGVPHADCLPRVLDSAGEFGRTRGLGFVPDGVPISGALGDQQAALAGQTCFAAGEAKCTYGTGAFLLANLGTRRLLSRSGMLTTVAWSLGGALTYAFEGSAFVAGAAVQFLRDQLQLIEQAVDAEPLARKVTAAPEVYFVPALAGLGAPHWDPRAQGAFFGLTRGTTKAQMIRAALEGIAFQVADLTEAMQQDLGGPLSVLRVDGGAAANDLLMQAQADFSQVVVDRPVNLETTAFGAGLFAGLGAGIYTSLDELKSVRQTAQLFQPRRELRGVLQEQRRGWARAVRAVQVFAGSEQLAAPLAPAGP